MSVHPKFDIEHSNCGNCAAFVGTVEGPHAVGSCHRFAPRPTAIMLHYPAGPSEGDDPAEDNPRGFSWPMVEDEFWCLDWFPRPGFAVGADESRWAEFFDTLSVRAKNALSGQWGNDPIGSFALLDALSDRDLRRIRNVGPTTVNEIRESRSAFPGRPTK